MSSTARRSYGSVPDERAAGDKAADESLPCVYFWPVDPVISNKKTPLWNQTSPSDTELQVEVWSSLPKPRHADLFSQELSDMCGGSVTVLVTC